MFGGVACDMKDIPGKKRGLKNDMQEFISGYSDRTQRFNDRFAGGLIDRGEGAQ